MYDSVRYYEIDRLINAALAEIAQIERDIKARGKGSKRGYDRGYARNPERKRMLELEAQIKALRDEGAKLAAERDREEA